MNPPSSSATIDPCPSSFGAPPVPPGSQSLTSLLLEASDVPPGYTTTGAATASPDGSAEFNGALPATVPVAYTAFSIDSGSGAIDQIHEGIIEALTEASSPTTATDLLRRTDTLVAECGGDGTTVTLPGSVPNLSAAIESGDASRSQVSSSAIVFATKGPYVLEVRWFNSNVIVDESAGPPADAPPLPTQAVMGSVVDDVSALSKLPHHRSVGLARLRRSRTGRFNRLWLNHPIAR
jgi:hypothetical protein